MTIFKDNLGWDREDGIYWNQGERTRIRITGPPQQINISSLKVEKLFWIYFVARGRGRRDPDPRNERPADGALYRPNAAAHNLHLQLSETWVVSPFHLPKEQKCKVSSRHLQNKEPA